MEYNVAFDPRHFIDSFAPNARQIDCCHPAFEAINLVTGLAKYPTAASMREPGGACGQEGKLWEGV